MDMKEAFTFDDVLIVPKFSTVASRKDVSLEITTSPRVFRDIGTSFPVISANMDTITGPAMAKAMLSYGGQACLHRFCSIEDNVKMFLDSWTPIEPGEEEYFYKPMVSIGLGKEELDRASALYGNNATTFIIDVAHGAQIAVVKQVKALREIIKDNGAIIVGNFASAESVYTFSEYVGKKIEGVKVGVGPGSACTTRIKTGVGYPQLSAVLDISKILKNTGIPVIADGGMKTPGDVAKAIGAGAHMVMLGGMLAGTDETPGQIVYMNRGIELPEDATKDPLCYVGSLTKYKKYRGSASKESYESQGKDAKHRTAEGESFLVPYKGPVSNVLQDIEGGLRSAMTYVGARTIPEFQEKCEFVRVTNAGYIEGTPHGKK